MANILVLTDQDDLHFVLVAAVLRRRGHHVTRLGLGAFPWRDDHSYLIRHGKSTFRSLTIHDTGLKFDTVWFRRIEKTDETRGSSIDESDREFARATYATYANWLHNGLERVVESTKSAMWINPWNDGHSAENKFLQLQVAQECGLTIPDTLISNDPVAIKKFISEGSGKFICKPLAMPDDDAWSESKTTISLLYTAVLPDLSSIPDASLRSVPAIYQPYIDKEYEVRSTFIDGTEFSVRIESQESRNAKIDWRADQRCKMRAYSLPTQVADMCRHVMRRLNLRFGCFDFVRRPDGRYVFLEVNEAGQFLFQERICPDLPLLDAICHLFAHGSLAGWRFDQPEARYEDVVEWPEVKTEIHEKLQGARERALAKGQILYR
jgi:glutathione synthase/RimK-type ligase-like ATP-grasp enzyme